jgi:hypothetical protein
MGMIRGPGVVVLMCPHGHSAIWLDIQEALMTATATRELTTLDRCDRCGAQAYIRATLASTGGQLFFCAHHARDVEATLRPSTSEWLDESSSLHERPSED